MTTCCLLGILIGCRSTGVLKLLSENHPYTGCVEEASPVGVSFLDMQILVHWSLRKVMYTPVVKANALSLFLTSQSGHPNSIHSSWLKAYLHRIRNRSSNIEWFNTFKHEVLSRLDAFGLDRTILESLKRETVFTEPVPIKFDGNVPKRDKRHIFRIVVPFHPLYSKAFASVCKCLSQHSRTLNIPGLQSISDIGVSWKLSSPALGSVIVKF